MRVSDHSQRQGDEAWLHSLTQALSDPAERALSEAVLRSSPSLMQRPAWFNVVTICGLVVLLLPGGNNHLRGRIADEARSVSGAPAVLGWRHERSSEGIAFDDRLSFGYRGMVAPVAVERSGPEWLRSTEFPIVDGRASPPVRIGFGAKTAVAAGVRRFVIRNIPASGVLSHGTRLADGSWVIEASSLNDVVVALIDMPPQDLAIDIEGQTQSGLLLAPGQVLFGARPMQSQAVSAIEQKPAPRMVTAPIVVPVPALEMPSPLSPSLNQLEAAPRRPSAAPTAAELTAAVVKYRAQLKKTDSKPAVRPVIKPTKVLVEPRSWRNDAFAFDKH